jgi:2'-5' RNA ligase
MRCFVAIDLPEHIKARIFHEIEILKQQGLVSGKFVEKENLHLTLKFLGELTEKQIKDIGEKLSEISFNKFKVSLSEIGVFPDKNFVKVLWVGLETKNSGWNWDVQRFLENKIFIFIE